MQQYNISYINRLLFLSFVVMITSCGQNVNDIDLSPDNDSQTEINLSSEQEYVAVKHELDSVLTIVLAEYKIDEEMTKNISTSQNTWVLYRDAQLLMKYPETDPLRNGSAFNVCYFSYLMELTKERIETLKPWISGAKEGDVCSGSIKIK